MFGGGDFRKNVTRQSLRVKTSVMMFTRPNIRVKLIAGMIFVVLLTGISSFMVGSTLISSTVLKQAYEQVQRDLKTGQFVYEERIRVIHLFTRHLAGLNYLQVALMNNDRRLIYNKLAEVRSELNLDILNITDARGRVIVRARDFSSWGDSVIRDDYVRYAINNRISCHGSDVMERHLLLHEGEDLADRAYVHVKETPKARRRKKMYEDRGLAIKAAVPMIHNGRLIGVVYGAKILNNNYEFVDRIKNLVFTDEKINGFDLGTATIFLDDLRISTNVTRLDGTRAVGTQISEEVYEKVFVRENVWLDKAFVVNNWYISAYQPLYDLNRKVIGILYVGILEEKYDRIFRKNNYYFLMIIVVTLIIATALAAYLVNTIIIPIRRLVRASKNIAEGEYTRKIRTTGHDELGYLSSTFNRMVDAIVDRDRKLQEQTEKKLVQSEKLASLGRLASGIAHEINNPLTGILTYSSILLEDLKGSDFEEDLLVIVRETYRCRDIVKGILEFARETKLEKKMVDINTIITNLMTILKKHVNFHNIHFNLKLGSDLPDIYLDTIQIESVLNNLAVNAADAMPDGGKINITTCFDEKKNKVVVVFEDTGTGIPEDIIEKIFDPFFSTKETGKGTGLGLAVSYGIIERHRGTIEVRSRPGEGTVFTIRFPVKAEDTVNGDIVISTDEENSHE